MKRQLMLVTILAACAAFSSCSKQDTENKSESSGMPVITIGTFNDANTNGMTYGAVASYINGCEDGYKVEVKEYELLGGESPLDGMAKDILSGDAPDIIVTYNLESMNLDKKGAFVDLYDFMENDEELNREMFNANMLSLAESDGHLYSVPVNFSIETVIGKKKYFDGMENWSINDYLDYLENSGQVDPDEFTREMATQCIDLLSFVDYDNASCDFNNEQFIRYLEFTSELDSIRDMPWLWDNENMSDEEINILFKEQRLAYRNDEKFLYSDRFSVFNFYFDAKYGVFGGDDITFVGNASLDGNGTRAVFNSRLAVSSTSENKELAWDAVKHFFSDEYYEKCFHFPMIQSKLEEAAEDFLKPVKNDDPEYNGYYYDIGIGTGYIEDNRIKIGLPDKEDADFVMELINSVNTVQHEWNEDIYSIINEECERFYSGGCTAEECADTVQNRVTVYLSEHY